jgi:hypothetical protein
MGGAGIRGGNPYAMPHLFEPAPSGRAECRGCGRRIQRGELRFGERLPNLCLPNTPREGVERAHRLEIVERSAADQECGDQEHRTA